MRIATTLKTKDICLYIAEKKYLGIYIVNDQLSVGLNLDLVDEEMRLL